MSEMKLEQWDHTTEGFNPIDSFPLHCPVLKWMHGQMNMKDFKMGIRGNSKILTSF